MLRSSLTVLVGMTLVMGACGGDDDGGGSGFKTSVDSSKRVDMLSASEKQTLCQEFSKWGESTLKSLKPKICRLVVLFTPDQKSCEAAVKECIEAPIDPSDDDSCDAPNNCSASVAEVQRCLNDQSKLLSDYFGSFPACSQAGPNVMLPPDPTEPASCTAIASKCPGFVEGFDDITDELDSPDEEEDEEIDGDI